MAFSRRRFLKTSLIVGAGTTFLSKGLLAQSGTLSGYDFIIIGAGTSGVIVARRLVDAGKKVLLIEAGAPTSSSVGGTDFPPYIKDRSKTIFDIPGEYGNIAFKTKGQKYQLKETPWTYQGMGFGGNSQINGMLFQMAPDRDFEENWPTNWRPLDLKPHLDRITSKLNISDIPSEDGVHYFGGLYEFTSDAYHSDGFSQKNTTFLGRIGERYYSRPYVVSRHGRRGGPVQTHLRGLVGKDGLSIHPRFTILKQCKVDKVVFEAENPRKATGVSFELRDTISDQPGDQSFRFREVALLKPEGRVVLAAGALMTPRLLYLSGVGPTGRHAEIFSQSSVPFHIDNEHIGTKLADHIGTGLVFEAPKGVDFTSIDYEDYKANRNFLEQYMAANSGPYAQYGPISVAHICSESHKNQPNVEYFVNPFGLGPAGGQFFGSRDFSVYTMLLKPKAKDLLSLDSNMNVKLPSLYLTHDDDLNLMAESISEVISTMIKKGAKLKFGPGGISHPNLSYDILDDVKNYVGSLKPFTHPGGARSYFTRLIMNHWAGTCPIGQAVDENILLVKGTKNIHVVDASLIPEPFSAHPVAGIMVVADRAGTILSQI